MPRILLDCDGPLADFTGGLCAALSARGYRREAESVLHWDLKASLSQEEIALLDEIVGEPGFCFDLPWVSGARGLVAFLRASAHEVLCVTSPWPSPTWMAERLDWLAPTFAAEDVLFVPSKRKFLVEGDILIEDHPAIACAWLDAHPDGYAILVDRPWNSPRAKEFWPHSRMYRAHSTGEIIELSRML